MATNTNKNLHSAASAKKDEYYTQLSDIVNELFSYKDYFKDKVILCNCDDPYESNFFKYFALNFNFFGLKKLITTCYSGSPISGTELNLFPDLEPEIAKKKAYKLEITELSNMDGEPNFDLNDVQRILKEHPPAILKGNGDFRSKECLEFLKEADIVVTNPPFSLFREFVSQIIDYEKKFIIIGNKNAITYKEIFPLISQNKLWIGVTPMSKEIYFDVPQSYIDEAIEKKKDRTVVKVDGKYMARTQSIWFTNLDIKKRHEKFISYKEYNPKEFPKYDNYDAIEVSKSADIPENYYGVMGVPITFLDKYNPEQFEILDARDYTNIERLKTKSTMLVKDADGSVNGKAKYARILIRRRNIEN